MTITKGTKLTAAERAARYRARYGRENTYSAGYKAGREFRSAESYNAGFAAGLHEGEDYAAERYNKGRADGLAAGLADGLAQGAIKAQERYQEGYLAGYQAGVIDGTPPS